MAGRTSPLPTPPSWQNIYGDPADNAALVAYVGAQVPEVDLSGYVETTDVIAIAQGGTGATTAATARTALGLGTTDSPTFSAINVNTATFSRFVVSASAIYPTQDNVRDLGTAGLRYNTGNFGTSVIAPTFAAAGTAATTLGNATGGVTVPGTLSAAKYQVPVSGTPTNVMRASGTLMIIGDPSGWTDTRIYGGTTNKIELRGTTFVASGSNSNPGMSFFNDADTGWWNPAADTLAASTFGVERLRIDSSGNVGIGGTPNHTLHVKKTDSTGSDALFPQVMVENPSTATLAFASIKTKIGTGYTGGYPELWLQSSGVSGGTNAVRGVSNHDLLFMANNTEWMRLLKTGGVRILAPIRSGLYTFGTVPTASSYTGYEITISDRAYRTAYSDGTNWRFTSDDAIIS